MVPRNFQIPFNNSNKFQILPINIIKLTTWTPRNRHQQNNCVFWLLSHAPSVLAKKKKSFSPQWFPSYVEICNKFFVLWGHHDWSLKIISHIVWPKFISQKPHSLFFWKILEHIPNTCDHLQFEPLYPSPGVCEEYICMWCGSMNFVTQVYLTLHTQKKKKCYLNCQNPIKWMDDYNLWMDQTIDLHLVGQMWILLRFNQVISTI